ncbi:ABC transporter substrate-binding protein [Psychrobacter sp. FME13]|uniref:ABC transporter substrate-binding protein n=1 Tax=unclassified Psychrobacter TaxID=196806 RepID=UPI001787F553|nr:ABC transporter substrate-binding protein [Psychrobacter sp. FME13]MBE0442432.1 ABC transporter substrate-binding protein [Psychrobacter sp. FME13]
MKALTFSFGLCVALCSSLLLSSCQSSDATSQAPQAPQAMSPQESQKAPKVMTPDWGIAATLTAMGYPPVAMGDKPFYREWVGKPLIPDTTLDVGTRYQPNPEMFSQLDLDLVIDNAFYAHLRPMYGDLPIHSIELTSPNKIAKWEDFIEPTLELGRSINKPQAAQDYLNTSKKQILQAGQTFHARYPHVKKLAVVQFADTNNLRMFSYNSLFQPALETMGLQLVALADGNQWGFTPIMLGDLAQLNDDTCLVVVEPLSDLLKLELEYSLVWQRLGYSFDQAHASSKKGRCIALLPATWNNSGVASMNVLAERLTNVTFVGHTDL